MVVGHDGDGDTAWLQEGPFTSKVCVSASQAPSSFGRISTPDSFKSSTKKSLFKKKKEVLIFFKKQEEEKKIFTFKTLFITLIA